MKPHLRCSLAVFPVASPERSTLHLNLTLNADDPALLQGLETWLHLGLISQETVLRLSEAQLTCPLPDPVPQPIVPLPPTPPRPPVAPTPVRRSLADRLVAEISVVWLLFLGVFLVVVSSGVLAATQWRNFSAIGQYGILFSYTLAFWAASVWTSRQPTLRLTTRMLRGATLLIVPLNFWTIDGFRLWHGIGWVVASIAALILTLITTRTLATAPDRAKATTATAIALNFLNWGWGWTGIPLLATYLGTISATAAILISDRPRPGQTEQTSNPLGLGTIALGFGALLLVFRAAFVVGVPLHQLGLAIAISGALLVWQSRLDSNRKLWLGLGVGLLLLGWLATVEASPPWQAIAISGIVLRLLADYLSRSGQGQFLSAMFLVGLQLCWLLWRVFPEPVRQGLIDRATQGAGTQGMPIALLGLGLFPYLVLTLWLAHRLRRQERSLLANQAELLALGLGSALTLISFANPLVRSLNLGLSALVLVLVTRRRAQPRLIYLTHGVILAAMGAGADVILPHLTLEQWAIGLLAATVAEWSLTAILKPTPKDSTTPSLWQQSSWRFGLLLAGGSYGLFLGGLFSAEGVDRSVAWLLVPALLTLLGYRPQPQRRIATKLSGLALLLVQILTVSSTPARLTSLGIAFGLMLLNTRQIPQVFLAALTLFFGLGFGLNSLWELGGKNFQPANWFTVIAIVPLLLWSLRHWLTRRETALATSYRRASDGWAIVLSLLLLLVFSVGFSSLYNQSDPSLHEFLPASAILLVALVYRTRQRSSNWGFYGVAWSLELLVINVLSFFTHSPESFAIANLALALTAQLLGDWQLSRPPLPTSPPSHFPTSSSWHTIPLLYAAIGCAFGHNSFNPTTGLYTLAAAGVGVGIGRRRSQFKPLTFFSLLAASFGGYELLLYQLSQAGGGKLGDGIVLLAGLAVAIALALRLLQRWISAYTRLNPGELQTIAHLHWGLGSGLLPLAIVAELSTTGNWLWLSVATVLSVYALATGNSRWMPGTVRSWTFWGIAEGLFTLAYGLHLLLPDAVLLDWGGTIAAIVAVGLNGLPWQKWGWHREDWRGWAIVLPGLVTLLTAWSIAVQSLLIVAAFYAWLARTENQVRLSYWSVVLADWAILRSLSRLNVTEPLGYAAVLGGSLLFVAQVDPSLRGGDDRQKRHWLRCLATGLICFTGFYQAEIGIAGVLSLALSGLVLLLDLVFVAAGLLLRVRAFLYVGTIAFLLQVLRQLWLFVAEYSILLWSIGIALGLLLIWVAATFEARRAQVSALLHYWAAELENWD